MSKKVICIIMVICIALEIKSPVSAKSFYASKNEITINKGKKKAVTITFKMEGSVYYEVKNKKIASAKWGKYWNGDKIKLYITGKKKGNTKIYVTNSKNNKVSVINVKVQSKAPKKKIYDMKMIDECWSAHRSWVETTYGDEWKNCIGLQIPYYESHPQGYAIFCSDKKYTWFSGKIGLRSYAGDHPDYKLKIYGDGKLIYTSPAMNKFSYYKKFKVNISGYKYIKVATDRTTYWGELLIKDGTFYN